MHPLVALVKKSVEEYVRHGKVLATLDGLGLDREMSEQAGVFVCLKKNGHLRGCIGTIEPATACIAHEAAKNAISSAIDDPRFSPVTEHELPELEYSVDVLGAPQRIRELSELDPSKYGVIVKKGMRRGLLLPALEGVSTCEEQLRIAGLKAGIDPYGADVEIYRFEVMRFR